MKIKYLGTGAVECIPALFCNCPTCNESRRLGGRNIRSTSQALIDDFMLMDLGPNTQAHFLKYNLSTEQIDTCFVTHNHFDHFAAGFFESAMFSSCYTKKFNIYLPSAAYNALMNEINGFIGTGKIEKQINYQIMEPFSEVTIKDNYLVHSYKANHDKRSTPQIYSIKNIKENKQMLYANDTGILSNESLQELKRVGGYYNLVSLDCTDALATFDEKHGHLTIKLCEQFLKSLKDMNLIDNNTKIVYTHFSHNGHATYDYLVEHYQKDNLVIAYDGLEIEF